MFKWIDRLLNRKPYFRISNYTQTLEGFKTEAGHLTVHLRSTVRPNEIHTITLSGETAGKLGLWLCRNFPEHSKSNIIKFPPVTDANK